MQANRQKCFKNGKWIGDGLLNIVKTLLNRCKRFPNIFYGQKTFQFYVAHGAELSNWANECEKIIKAKTTGTV